MKNLIKFIFLIFATTICTGCVQQKSEDINLKQKYDSVVKNDTLSAIQDTIPLHIYTIDNIINDVYFYNKYIEVYKFNYKGHTYIMFSHNRWENGVVHDPDCECFHKH